ncbi:hypothetical protein G7Y79_00012g032330 [Physcia stellaris]|nr:hypothetical protein G7Y79_00012g032330 [Physcia stellaris]
MLGNPLRSTGFSLPIHRIPTQSLTQQADLSSSHWPHPHGASRPANPHPGFVHSSLGTGVDHRAQLSHHQHPTSTTPTSLCITAIDAPPPLQISSQPPINSSLGKPQPPANQYKGREESIGVFDADAKAGNDGGEWDEGYQYGGGLSWYITFPSLPCPSLPFPSHAYKTNKSPSRRTICTSPSLPLSLPPNLPILPLRPIFRTLTPKKSQAIATPHAIYISGQLPALPDGSLPDVSIAEKTALCIANLRAILKEAGSGIGRVVKVCFFP